MAIPVFGKDDNSVLPWSLGWRAWLANEGNDVIETAEAIVPDELVLEEVMVVEDGTRVLIWLSGGSPVDGTKHTVICRIHTLGGRTEDKSFIVKMTDH